jgi:hypothetical protein
LFLPSKFILKELYKPKFQLKKLTLYRSCELDCNHHFKKSLRNFKEGNLKIAKKNISHAFRWILFAFQIVEKNEIYNLQAGNEYFEIMLKSNEEEFMNLYEKFQKEAIKMLRKLKGLLIPNEIKRKNQLQLLDYIGELGVDSPSKEFTILTQKHNNLIYYISDEMVSPFEYDIVKECSNSLIFDTKSNSIVSYPQQRILPFNEFKQNNKEYMKEYQLNVDKFNSKEFHCYKITNDITRAVIMFHHEGEWKISSTRDILCEDEIIKTKSIDSDESFYHFNHEFQYNPWRFFTDDLSVEKGFTSGTIKHGKQRKEFKTLGEYFWYQWNEFKYSLPKDIDCCYSFEISVNEIIDKVSPVQFFKNEIILRSVRNLKTLTFEPIQKIAQINNWSNVIPEMLTDLTIKEVYKLSFKNDLRECIGFYLIDNESNYLLVYSNHYHAAKRLLWFSKENEKHLFTSLLSIVRNMKGDYLFEKDGILNRHTKEYEKLKEEFHEYVQHISELYQSNSTLDKANFAKRIKNEKKKFKIHLYDLYEEKVENIENYFQTVPIEKLGEYLKRKY